MYVFRLWPTGKRIRTAVAGCWPIFALLGFLIVSVIQSVQAQNACLNPPYKGDFKVDKPRVCVGNPVTIIDVPASLSNVGYNYQYDGKSSIDKVVLDAQNKTFTYAKPGSYTILQAGSGNAVGTIFCQTVTVLPLDPITFTAKSCSGLKVTVTPNASTLGQYDTYRIDWNDGNPPEELSRTAMEANPEHTYNGNGSTTRTIIVVGVYRTAASDLCTSPAPAQTVTLVPAGTRPAITTLKTVSDNAISLQFQTSLGSEVQLYQKVNGVYTNTGQKGTSAGTFTVQTDAKQVQCFQVAAQDACGNASLKSDEVCSLVLDVKAANKKNNLSWQPYTGVTTGGQFRFYRINRNNAPSGGTIANQNTAAYTDDNAIACGTQYCYSVVATIAGSAAQIEVTSASVCVTGVNGDVPNQVDNVVVSVENNHPKIVTALSAPASGTLSSYTLVISRADGSSGSFNPIGTVLNDGTFVDTDANASAGSSCYQVTYQGVCGLTLPPSKPVCSVFLTPTAPTVINWTGESPFIPGPVTGYTLEITNSLGGTVQKAQLGTSTRFDLDPNDPDTATYTYRIMANSAGQISYSNYITISRDAKIIVPDAFTPNGDQMNDEFLPKGITVDRFLMNIYSRWGEVVYSTSDKTKGWNGQINGVPAAMGQYMFRIEVEDLSGQKTVRTGAVLLIR